MIFRQLLPGTSVLRQTEAVIHCSAWVNSIHRKRQSENRRKRNAFPKEFEERLKQWPRILQAEIDFQNEFIKTTMADYGDDWSVLTDRGIVVGPLMLLHDIFEPKGRVLTFKRFSHKKVKGFSPGAPLVLCRVNDLNPIVECIALQSGEDRNIQVICRKPTSRAIDSDNDDMDYLLMPSQNYGALQSLQDFFGSQLERKTSPGCDLLDLAYRAKPMPSIHSDRGVSGLEQMNDGQKRAVAAAMNRKRPFVCIQGPPGTGKTRVASEIIYRLMRDRKKILVCAPTHTATDNILEATTRLLQQQEDLGNHGALSASPLSQKGICDKLEFSHTLPEAMSSHPKHELLCQLTAELNETRGSLDKKEKTKLNKRIFDLRLNILRKIYSKRSVIFCTASSSVVRNLRWIGWNPDVVLVDEAAQLSEASIWPAVVRAPRCILVGDPAQLPTVVLSDEGRKQGFQVSLMERLLKEFSRSNLGHLLNIQYRMNTRIQAWSSEQFYDNRLVADPEVSERRLSDVFNIPPGHLLNEPLILINTDLCERQKTPDFYEKSVMSSFRNEACGRIAIKLCEKGVLAQNRDTEGQYVNIVMEKRSTQLLSGQKWFSIGEAAIVLKYLTIMMQQHDLSFRDIAVVSPYFGQVQLLRDLLLCNECVSTVDSLQGRERELVVISLTRNNARKSVGFLQESRRMNVAVTRARRQVVLIGSGRMMRADPALRNLHRTIQEQGKIYSPQLIEGFVDDTAPSCAHTLDKMNSRLLA